MVKKKPMLLFVAQKPEMKKGYPVLCIRCEVASFVETSIQPVLLNVRGFTGL